MANGDGDLRRRRQQEQRRRRGQTEGAAGAEAFGLRREVPRAGVDPRQGQTEEEARQATTSDEIRRAQREQREGTQEGRALRAGVGSVQAAVPGTAGAVTGALGFEDTAEGFIEQTEDIQRDVARNARGLTRFSDVVDPETGEFNPSNIPSFATETLAMEVPSLAAQTVGGVGGSAAGVGLRRSARRFRQRGRRRAPAGRQQRSEPDRQQQREQRESIADEVGIGGRRRQRSALEQSADQRAAATGAVAGGATTGGAIATGEILPRLTTDPNADESSTQNLSTRALAGGTASGALQAIPFAGALNRLGLGRRAAEQTVQRSFGRRLAQDTLGQAAREAPVDVAQAAISRQSQALINDNLDLLDDQGMRELLEAGASSAVVGGVTGAATSAIGQARSRAQQQDRGTLQGDDASIAARMEGDAEGDSAFAARMEGVEEGDGAQILQGDGPGTRARDRQRQRQGEQRQEGRIRQRMERRRRERAEREREQAAARRQFERIGTEAPELLNSYGINQSNADTPRGRRRLSMAELDLAASQDPRGRLQFTPGMDRASQDIQDELVRQRDRLQIELDEIRQELEGTEEGRSEAAEREIQRSVSNIEGLDRAIIEIDQGRFNQDPTRVINSLFDATLNEDAELTPALFDDIRTELDAQGANSIQVADLNRLRAEERGQDPSRPISGTELANGLVEMARQRDRGSRVESQDDSSLASLQRGVDDDESTLPDDSTDTGSDTLGGESLDVFSDVNFQEIETTPRFLNNAERPASGQRQENSLVQTNRAFFVGPETTRAVHGTEFSNNAVDTNVRKLREQFPEEEFEPVPLGEALEAEARENGITDPAQIEQFVNDRADELADFYHSENRRTVADLWEEGKPREFVDRFTAIRRRQLPKQLVRGDDEVMSPGEVDQLMRPVRDDQLRRETQQFTSGQLRRMPVSSQNQTPPRGEIPVQRIQTTADATTGELTESAQGVRLVNAMDMAKTMMRRRGMDEDSSLDANRVADLVLGGMNAIATSPHVRAETMWGRIDDDLVVFTDSNGREYTFGEIKRRGAGQLRERVNRLDRVIRATEDDARKQALQEERDAVEREYRKARRTEGTDAIMEGVEDRHILSNPQRYSDDEVADARQRQAEREERHALGLTSTLIWKTSDSDRTKSELLADPSALLGESLENWSLNSLTAYRGMLMEDLSSQDMNPQQAVETRKTVDRVDEEIRRKEELIGREPIDDEPPRDTEASERGPATMGSRESEGVRGDEARDQVDVAEELRARGDDVQSVTNPARSMARAVQQARRGLRRIEEAETKAQAQARFRGNFGIEPGDRGRQQLLSSAAQIKAQREQTLLNQARQDRVDEMQRQLKYASRKEARNDYEMLFGEALPEDVTLTQIQQLLNGELVVAQDGSLQRKQQDDTITPEQEAQRRQRFQSIASKWAERLGLEANVRVVSRNELASLVDDAVMRSVDSGNTQGFATPMTSDGQYLIYVNERLSDVAATETLAHEMGHVIYRERVQNLSDEDAQTLMRAFHKWRKQQDNDNRPVRDVHESKASLQRMTDALEESHKGKAMGDISSTEREYLLRFDEWFADNVSRWLTQTKEPQGVVQRFFQSVANAIKDLIAQARADGSRFRADRSVASFMRSMWHDRARQQASEQATRQGVEGNDPTLPKPAMKRIEKMDRIQALQATEQDRSMARDLTAFAEGATNDPYGEDMTNRIKMVVDKLLSTQEKGVLGRAFTAPHVRRQLRELVKDPAQMASIDNGNARLAIALGYQFWMSGDLQLGRQSNSIFNTLRKDAEGILGIYREETRAERILEAMQQGRVEARRTGALVDRSIAQRFRQGNKFEEHVAKTVEMTEKALSPLRYVRPASSRVVASGIPQLEAIVDTFFPRVESEGRGRSMFEGRQQNMSRFFNGFDDATRELTQEQGRRVLEILQNPNERARAGDPAVVEAADKIQKQLRQMRDYALQSGVDLGDRGDDYFPSVWDTDTILENRRQFVNLIAQEKYDDFLGLDRQSETPLQEQREQAAERIVDAILQHDGYGDSPQTPADGGNTPFMASAHQRTLGWLWENASPSDQRALAEFQSKDLGRTLAIYTEQIVKRSEYARQFGVDGSRLEAMLTQAKDFGATDEQIKDARNFVSAMMGTMGRELPPAIRAVLRGIDNVFGTDMQNARPEDFRKIQGAIMVYQNIRVLGLATLTSIADTAGLIVRSDYPDVALEGFRAGLREIGLGIQQMLNHEGRPQSEFQSEVRRLARDLGTIDTHLVNEVLDEAFSGQYLTGTARKANEMFFRAIQLQRWTRFSRTMGVASARAYLRRMAEKQGVYDGKSERFRDQLGLKDGDIRLDDQGEVIIMSNDEREQMQGQAEAASAQGRTVQAANIREELARDARVRTAMNRFVDQAIMRPNASQRPLIASHPDAQLFFHLKQFAFTIQTQMVNRVVNETKQGNMFPLAATMTYVPIMIAADMLRELIQHGPEGDPRKRNWGFFDYTTDAIHRSGMTGVGTFLLDSRKDVTQFGGVGIESLVGPTASQAQEIGGLLTDSNADAGRTFVDALPANSIYSQWDLFELEDSSFDKQTGAVSYR